MRRMATLTLVLFGLWACGGGSDTATTASSGDEETTTTAETTTTEAEGEPISVAEIPAECREIFIDYLKAIEPFVGGINADSSLDDFAAVNEDIIAVSEDMTAKIEGAGCDDLNVTMDDEESRELMLSMARDEAPGTVGYLEAVLSMGEQFGGGEGGGGAASGDCETDIDSLQVFVDGDKNLQQLTISEVAEVTALLTAIQQECTGERMEEVFNQPDVQEFLNG